MRYLIPLSALALMACTSSVDRPAPSDLPMPPAEAELPVPNPASDPLEAAMPDPAPDVVTANTRLGAALLSELSRGHSGNVFISPLSLSTAMGMLYAGADGKTRDSIARVFHYPEGDVHADLARLAEDANRTLEDPNAQHMPDHAADPQILAVNNSLWVDETFELKPDYLATVERHYGAAPSRLDFEADPAGSRETINGWVEARTRDRIRDLLGESDVTPDTAAVLVNTVYMMAHWRDIFSESDTQPRDFRVAGKRTEPRAMMQRVGRYALARTETGVGGAGALRIPYANDMSMIVILPDEADGLAGLDREMDAARIEAHLEALEAAEPVRVDLRLPKFSLEARYRLAEPLEAIGLSDVILPARADLSRMTDDRRAAVSRIIQQVFLDVNERGTEAAAATAIVIVRTSASPPQPKPLPFHIDRPFLMLLRDDVTGAIVFMGRITDPVAPEN
ncbi:MAG: serpin family protein [Pseudomonadota bacterium]